MLRAICCIGAALVAAPAAAERVHRYAVAVDAQIRELRVRACFDGAPPAELVADSLDAAALLEQARVEGGRRLEPNGAQLKLGALPDDACVAYSVQIGRHQPRHQRGAGPTLRVGDDLIAEIALWLWRPPVLEPDQDIELRFDLPEGISASAPWPPRPGAAGTAYRVGRTPPDWPGSAVIGRFAERTLDVPGARLRVVLLHGVPEVPWDLVQAWLMRAASTVTTLYGRFPVSDLQVVIVPNARGAEPVPAAYVLRGGRPAVHFFINQRRPRAEFLSDSTAVHELSHLLLPFVRPEDAWLSEGLASYYEHVLRARRGTISPQEAWRRLDAGFRRGAGSLPGATLAQATERMYRDGGHLRVYWQGAAMWLLADQRLRSRSGGEQSLDRALDRLQRCCLAPEAGWGARALFAQLDRLTGGNVFAGIYDEYVGASRFPDLAECYAALGLRRRADGEGIELLDTGQGAALREAITTAAESVD
jgi:hypothetical protein